MGNDWLSERLNHEPNSYSINVSSILTINCNYIGTLAHEWMKISDEAFMGKEANSGSRIMY